MKKRKLKPQVKAILIFLGIIIFLILLENGLNALGKYAETHKYQKEYEQKQEEYKETPKYKEEQYVAECVEKTIELINAKDYEKLYNLLDPTYKEIFEINSVEIFKEVLKERWGGVIDNVSLADHHLEANRYVCKISISEGDLITQRELVVTPVDGENYYVILDDIKYIEEMTEDYTIGNSSLAYKLTHKIHKNEQMIYVIEITNKTKSPIVGSLENSVLQRTNRIKYNLLNKDELVNVTIPADGVKRVLMAYTDKSSVQYYDDSLNIDFKMSDGTLKTNVLDLSYKYWE